MHSPHVHPAVGRRGELDNDHLYMHHPSRRLDFQSPLALAPLSSIYSPKLIDNMYLITSVYSTDSATTSTFLVYKYIPEASADDIANIISAQLNEMQKSGALNSADDHTSSMTAHSLMDTHLTTYLDDKRIIQTTIMTSPHLENVPHAFIVTTPTFFSATYGLTLLASRQLRWTTDLLEEYIHTRLPESLRKSLLAQVPTIANKNVDKPNNAKDTCTIYCHDF